MKTGAAFPDFIRAERKQKKHFGKDTSLSHSMHSIFLLLLLIVSMGVLLGRAFFLQIVQGDYYRKLSDSNRIRTAVIHAPRGIIFDANTTPLVYNIPGFRTQEKGKTVILTREEALPLIAKGTKNIEIDNLRQYPLFESSAHVIGYIGEVTKEELQREFLDRNGGDLVGKYGIERMYEKELRGVDGKQLVEVDVWGKTIRKLGQTDTISGKDIYLTLDARLQQKSYEAMPKDKKGVVIVSTPKGEIKALVSKPSFDPNLFTLGERYKPASISAYTSIAEVLTDSENQPLLNRAISGTYPPGSTFKLVTAAAGLEGNIIDSSYSVEDTGVLTIGEFSFANWYFTQYGGKEGSVDVVKAIKRSNDIFFYKLAAEVGVDKLSESAKKFGVGSVTGIDLQGEAKGILPTKEWKEKVIGEPWYLGDTYHYGIGQGYLSTTPLQVNLWTQGIANGGMIYQPHLLKNSELRIQNSELLSGKNFSLIRQGMIESCSPGGVAWPLFEFKVKNEKLKIDGRNFLEAPESTTSGSLKDYRELVVACKTGTAQHGGEKDLPHAWITLFAPAYDPQIVVTVLVESSGEGSNIAAPIAKKVLEEWFGR